MGPLTREAGALAKARAELAEPSWLHVGAEPRGVVLSGATYLRQLKIFISYVRGRDGILRGQDRATLWEHFWVALG